MEDCNAKTYVRTHTRETLDPTSSNGSLIDWDKNILDYVYSCIHPEPHRLPNQPAQSTFLKSHRRIVSATSPYTFQAPVKPSRLLPRPHGHIRNASDPGMHLFFTPTPIFLPIAHENRNISNVEIPMYSVESVRDGEAVRSDDGGGFGVGGSGASVDHDIKSTGCLIPSLQSWANSVVLLICLCVMAFVQSMVSSGYLSSIITTLERRFDLTSRQVGYMYSCYEVTSVISTIGFSFLDGQRQNRPKIIGLLGLVLGLGFGLFALPHWLSGVYNPSGTGIQSLTQKSIALCSSKFFNATHMPPAFIDRSHCNLSEVTVLRIGEEVLSTDYTVALPLFCCAMALAGVGSSSLFVLAPTYFWDNLPPGQYPIYSGILYSCAGLGPAFGFIAGAAFLQIYIDAPMLQPPLASSSSSSSLDAYSPAWLGAWWLGMVVFGALACLTALPVLTFPRNLSHTGSSAATSSSTSETPPAAATAQAFSQSTTVVSTPENEDMPHPATGDRGQSMAPSEAENPESPSSRYFPASTALRYFPETIPEVANESVGINRSLSSTTTTAPTRIAADEVDYKVHRRQSSKGGGASVVEPVATSSSPAAWIVDGKRVLRSSSGRKAPRLPALPEKLKRGFRGTSNVFCRVVSNPIWLGVTATTVTEQTIVSAYLTYAAKYLQAQFRIPAHLASIHTGAVVVPSAVLGVLSGALMMRHYRPSISRALVASLMPLFATLCTVLILMFGLGCSTNHVAGVTSTYDGKPFHALHSNLTAACNAVCRTTPPNSDESFSCPLSSDYNPVCWHQTVMQNGQYQQHMSFLNPCLAGCSGHQNTRTTDGTVHETFTNCNCVNDSSLVPEGMHSRLLPANASFGLGGGTVTRGACNPRCSNYISFLVVTFVTIFLTAINQNPSNVITLSCVDPDDETAALGLQVFFARTLAFIPTPIYFGMLMDRSCLVRAIPLRHICESSPSPLLPKLFSSLPPLVTVEGACLEYDVYSLPYAWLGVVTIFKCLSIVIGIITWRYSVRRDARRPPRRLDSQLGDVGGGGSVTSRAT